MSARCVACIVRHDPESTPARAVLLTVALIKAESIETLIGHLCEKHRRTLDQGLAGSLGMLRKLMS